MCLRHWIKLRAESEPFILSADEYEEKYGLIQRTFKHDGDERSVSREVDETFHVLTKCIYGYNLDLLYYLLTNQERRKFHREFIQTRIYRKSYSDVITRHLALMILTGDYTVAQIAETIRLFYESELTLSPWYFDKDPIKANSLTEYKNVIKEVAQLMLEDKTGFPNARKENMVILEDE